LYYTAVIDGVTDTMSNYEGGNDISCSLTATLLNMVSLCLGRVIKMAEINVKIID